MKTNERICNQHLKQAVWTKLAWVTDRLFIQRNVCTNPFTDTAHSNVSICIIFSKSIEKAALGCNALDGQKPSRTSVAAADSWLQKVIAAKCERPAALKQTIQNHCHEFQHCVNILNVTKLQFP